jgi:D-sedoheptulose 7-phosphate isomerase
MKIILLTGQGGSALTDVEVNIAVPSNDTARIQEVHGLIIHLWCHALDQAFMDGEL